jgi:hypothetical protein
MTLLSSLRTILKLNKLFEFNDESSTTNLTLELESSGTLFGLFKSIGTSYL